MWKIAKNYIYNLVYQLLTLLIPLITAPYLVRVLGAEGTGTYSYVNSLTVLISTCALLGIYNYGNRQIAYVRDDKELLNKCFWEIMSTRLILLAIGTIIYITVVLVIGRYENLFLIYYMYFFGYAIDCSWLYVGVEDMKWAVIKNIITKLVTVFGIFILIKSEQDLWLYVCLQGGSHLFGNLLAYSQLHKYVSKPIISSNRILEHIIGSALLFLPSLAATVYLQCDKIMIELLTNETSQVSFYDYAEKIVLIPLSFITVLSTVMMPRIANEYANGREDGISKLLTNAAKTSMFLAVPLMIGLISIAKQFIPWYLGESFLPTITAIYVISPIIITNTLSGISGTQYFTATNQISILMKSQVSAALGNVLLNALLIPNWGFVGAAIATFASSMTCAIVQYFYLLKQVKLKGLFEASIKYLLFSIIMMAVIFLTTRSMPSAPLTTLVQILIGGICFVLLCCASKDRVFFNICHILNKKFKKW